MTALLSPSSLSARSDILARVLACEDASSLAAALPDDRHRYRMLERLRWPEGFRCPRCDDRSGPERLRPGMLGCRRCQSIIGVIAR